MQKITIELTDQDMALLEKAVAMKNQQRQRLADKLEAKGKVDLAENLRIEMPLDKYAYVTFVQALKEEVTRDD